MQGTYCISGSVYTNIVSNTVLVTNMYTLHNIRNSQLPDSRVNTALQQVCHSGLTGLETS